MEDGKITLVGTDVEVREKVGEHAEYIDLKGHTVLPGFIDSHMHVLQGAEELLFKVNLAEAASKEDCLEIIASFYREHPDIDFLEGVGWINTYFDDLGPRKEWLDEIAADIPMVLDSGDHHSIWTNSKAIEMAGVSADTVIDGGVLEIDPDTGELSGTFRENAQAPFHAIKPVYPVAKVKEAIVYFEKLLGGLGITMVHDPMVELGSNDLTAYKEMDAEGKLNMKIRGSLMTRPETIEAMRDEYISEREACNQGGHFEVNSIKVLLDGVIEGAPNIRPVGAHMQIVDQADYERLKKRNIIASANPYWFAKEKGYFYGLEVPYLGEDRAEHEYPMKSLKEEAGVRLASGSDFPVTFPPAPLMGIQMGVTRCDFRDNWSDPDNILNADESVAVNEMIRSFTINAAYADFAEEITGSITPGKYADFVVLGQNIFDVSPDQIGQIPILMTVSEGKVIYDATVD